MGGKDLNLLVDREIFRDKIHGRKRKLIQPHAVSLEGLWGARSHFIFQAVAQLRNLRVPQVLSIEQVNFNLYLNTALED
jgi:hypothetical protein